MKRNNLLLLIFLSVSLGSTAQQEIALHENQILIASSARFFDSGVEGEMPNEYLKATIKAPSGYSLSGSSRLHFEKEDTGKYYCQTI